jgi:hypothetical protein
MPLVNEHPETEAPAQRLVRETKNQLSEFTQTAMIVYGNLMNYQHNNAEGVTAAEYNKAMGADAKDLAPVMRAMKRLILKLNPALKARLNEMVPQKSKKAAK